MKGPYSTDPTPRRDWSTVLIFAFVIAMGLFFFGMMYSFYISSYNRAMVACLEKHSKDVCVETLR